MKKELFEAIKEAYTKYRLYGPKTKTNFSRFKAGFIAGMQYGNNKSNNL